MYTNSCKKRNVATLNSAHQVEKQYNFDSGWNGSRAVYIASSESWKLKRFVRCWNKVDFVHRMDQELPKYRIGIWIKKWWWTSFVWMVDVVPKGVWVLYSINKDKGDEKFKIWNIPSDVCYDDTKNYQTLHLNTSVFRAPSSSLRWGVFAYNLGQNI